MFKAVGFALGVLFAVGCSAAASAPVPEGLDLKAYRGRVVYLDFWASWCAPCRAAFPWLIHAQRAWAERGLVVIAINLDQQRAPADRFVQEFKPPFTILFDPQASLAQAFAVVAMPSSVMIDRNGRVRFHHSGFFVAEQSEYEHEIAELLREPGAASAANSSLDPT